MHKLVRKLLVFAACLTWHHAKASPCMNGDDSSIQLAYGGVPPADKWSWDAAGVHFTCNDANYFGTESVPVHESGDYDAACLQGGNSAWLQLDLGESMFVTGIVIQGRPDWEQYVKRYTVQGSIDDITWIDMPCKNKDSANRCIGSSDRSTKVTNEFAQVVNVRYVKLFVKDYHVYASLRMSVYISCPLSCPPGSTLPPGSSTLDDCTCDSGLRSDLGPIYDGRPPVSAWSYSALSSDASCSNPIDFGVHDGVDTGVQGTACFAAVNLSLIHI